jgi:hypothetical protein
MDGLCSNTCCSHLTTPSAQFLPQLGDRRQPGGERPVGQHLAAGISLAAAHQAETKAKPKPPGPICTPTTGVTWMTIFSTT